MPATISSGCKPWSVCRSTSFPPVPIASRPSSDSIRSPSPRDAILELPNREHSR